MALLRRQLPFRWPLLSYITARFSFLIAVILHATQSSPFYTSVYCQSINFAIIFWTNVAVCCSTTNLMIRTHAHVYLSYHIRSHEYVYQVACCAVASPVITRSLDSAHSLCVFSTLC
ncbi:hypothetical protein F4604DRAFT_1759461, partial [Suillus subluteus]